MLAFVTGTVNQAFLLLNENRAEDFGVIKVWLANCYFSLAAGHLHCSFCPRILVRDFRFHEGRPLCLEILPIAVWPEQRVYCRGLYQTVLSRDSVSRIAFPVPTSPDVGPSRRAEER